MSNKQSFVDKYRPNKVKDIVGNLEAIDYLKTLNDKPPHLLFAGRQGTGKTTAAYALCEQLMGKDWRKNVKVINSSMKRGIDVIRDEVRQFASTRALSSPYKIIILDECDGITPDGQKALRGTMEDYSSNVSFILTCNYPEKLIEPLKSRCTMFYFKPINKDQSLKLISRVIIEERIDIPENVAEMIAENGNGDMRKVLSELERLKAKNRPITIDDINVVAYDEIDPVLDAILNADFKTAKDGVFKLTKDGVEPQEILRRFFLRICENSYTAKFKLATLDEIAKTEVDIKHGTSGDIQLVGLLVRVIRMLKAGWNKRD